MTTSRKYRVVVPDIYREVFKRLLHEQIGIDVPSILDYNQEEIGRCVGSDLTYAEAEWMLHSMENEDVPLLVHSLDVIW